MFDKTIKTVLVLLFFTVYFLILEISILSFSKYLKKEVDLFPLKITNQFLNLLDKIVSATLFNKFS
ncbi:hypothetical protein oki361_23940 [Helicobacter pylori]